MLIDYQNIKVFQEDVCVLENVNFHADEGEFIYIIGKVVVLVVVSFFVLSVVLLLLF